MDILVTGGDGFLGRVLIGRLAGEGHRVTVLSRRPPRPDGGRREQGDVRDQHRLVEIVGSGRFDAVFHLAARTRARESFGDPLGYYETNLIGTHNLLTALDIASSATGVPGHLVFASTGAVYGPGQDGRIPETAAASPNSPYGASKLAAEHLISHQAATGRLGAVSLRTFNVAGAVGGIRDTDDTRLIPKALAVAAGRARAFPMNGDGGVRREFTHVADLAEACALALHAIAPGHHDVYNVGGGEAVRILDVIAVVQQTTGRNLPIDQRPPQREPAELIADSGLIRRRLGWNPTRSDLTAIITDAWAAIPTRS